MIPLSFIPFQPEHLEGLRLQRAQRHLKPLLAIPEYGRQLVTPYSWTGVANGAVVGCAGLLPQWPGRAIAWALLTPQLDARQFLRAHLRVRRVIETAQRDGMRRIEASVDAAFDAGHRWALALDFAPEGLMRRFSPEGRDHLLYARIS